MPTQEREEESYKAAEAWHGHAQGGGLLGGLHVAGAVHEPLHKVLLTYRPTAHEVRHAEGRVPTLASVEA